MNAEQLAGMEQAEKERAGRSGPKAAVLPGVLATALAAVWAVPGLAQTAGPIERHPVEVPTAKPGEITIDAATYGSNDTKPYGVALAGVRLIGEADPVASTLVNGIDVAAAPAPAGKDGLRPALAAALAPLLGKPLSAHEIAALQATVAGVYRSFGLPFVSVTAPPQEITAGVVQLRVIAFRAGTVSVKGPGGRTVSDARAVGAGVRLKPGDTVDARALSEDIDWLNRNPFRHVGAVFSHGEATALTNLSLETTESRSWMVTAGWSNDGSSATGRQRYSLGAGVFLPWANGTTVSALLTGGNDFFAHPDRIALKNGDYPAYLSGAARIVVPIAARQQIEFSPDLVATRQDLDTYTSVQSLTFELPVVYRTAVSNLLPGHYWGDLYGGVSVKGLRRKVYFAGMDVASGSAGLMQFELGWSDTISDALGQTALDLSVQMNPGDTIANSSDAAWSRYSSGRVPHASYVYGVVNVTRRTTLPKDFAWVGQLTGVMAGTPLPDTERLALGGTSGSRGYGFFDVAVDRGVILRNELRAPTLAAQAGLPAYLSPYLFADAAWGEDLSTKRSERLISLGVGANVAIAGRLNGSFSAGRAMTDAGLVRAGSWTVTGSLGLRF